MMSAKELQEFNKNRKITQVCYVTNDYRKTIEYLTNTLNWGPWTILKNNQISAHDVKSDGKPVEGDFEFLIAATFIGGIEFEIIQPIHGVNPSHQGIYSGQRRSGCRGCRIFQPRAQGELSGKIHGGSLFLSGYLRRARRLL